MLFNKKQLLGAFFLFFCITSQAFANEPNVMAYWFTKNVSLMKFDKACRYLSMQDIKDQHAQILEKMKPKKWSRRTQDAKSLFGKDLSEQSILTMPKQKLVCLYFSRQLDKAFNRIYAEISKEELEATKVSIIGAVKENDSKIHYVARVYAPNEEDTRMRQLVTVIKENGQWRILLNARYKLILSASI